MGRRVPSRGGTRPGDTISMSNANSCPPQCQSVRTRDKSRARRPSLRDEITDQPPAKSKDNEQPAGKVSGVSKELKALPTPGDAVAITPDDAQQRLSQAARILANGAIRAALKQREFEQAKFREADVRKSDSNRTEARGLPVLPPSNLSAPVELNDVLAVPNAQI